MLQQTPVARVIPRLEEWLARWPTPADLAAVPPGEAVRAWDRLGYPRRALALHGAATAIAERHGNVVPADVDALLALPGVGPYTARAVAAFAYGVRTPVVDINARRVLARAVEGRGEPGPAQTRRELALMETLLPADPARARLVNAGTMELGQVVCTARAPRCDVCPIADDLRVAGGGLSRVPRAGGAEAEDLRGQRPAGARSDPARAACQRDTRAGRRDRRACGRMPCSATEPSPASCATASSRATPTRGYELPAVKPSASAA